VAPQVDAAAPHEAGLLHLVSDQAQKLLGWRSRWNFDVTVARTVGWYRQVHQGVPALQCCLDDLQHYGFGNHGH
jgi:CDP-glucose 4,6-dehydratase